MMRKKKRHLELINWSSSLHANLIPLFFLLLAYGDSTLYGLTVAPNHPLHHLGTRKSMQFPVASHGEDIDLPEPEGPARKPCREDDRLNPPMGHFHLEEPVKKTNLRGKRKNDVWEFALI